MPCGCSGGTWTPPDQQQTQTAGSGKDGQQPQPAQRPAATGPAAPGYYHGSNE